MEDSLAWLQRLHDIDPPQRCYQGRLNPEAAWAARERRLARDKAQLRESLRVIAKEIAESRIEQPAPKSFGVDTPEDDRVDQPLQVEVTLAEQPLPIPDVVREQLTSILLDLGEIPPEYLTPAGEGEYDPTFYEEQSLSPDDVWGGAYHEEGAFLYNEWDVARQAHKKDWCVLREMEVEPSDLAFYHQTLGKYAGFARSLRRTFEILRGEDRLLTRQTDGEDIDIDALVEAWGDVHMGLEMTDRLFTRMHKEERNIAVMFMVDMSGSTRGWINDAEREALILLAEALNTLGDRYAIYGEYEYAVTDRLSLVTGLRYERFELEDWALVSPTTLPTVLTLGAEPYDYDVYAAGLVINDLMDISKIEAGQVKADPKEIDIREQAEYLVSFFNLYCAMLMLFHFLIYILKTPYFCSGNF